MVKKNYKGCQHKIDIDLFIIKPTIATFNIFYLKLIIFKNNIGQKLKIFDFDQV